MEDMYCYVCGEVQNVEKEYPRYDWDDHGKVEITDVTCCNCKRRIRLSKRLSQDAMDSLVKENSKATF